MRALLKRDDETTVRPGSGSLAASLRARLVDALPATTKRSISFHAGIAEFLLLTRLKARSQKKFQAAQMLERAAQIVFVTCRHWFSAAHGKLPQRPAPL